jgi:hypothetical protein
MQSGELRVFSTLLLLNSLYLASLNLILTDATMPFSACKNKATELCRKSVINHLELKYFLYSDLKLEKF